jgi:hypothetical protein
MGKTPALSGIKWYCNSEKNSHVIVLFFPALSKISQAMFPSFSTLKHLSIASPFRGIMIAALLPGASQPSAGV